MNLKNWGGKMKWGILSEITKDDSKYEYERYGLYTDGWYLHLYVEEGTELHDIVKTFTEDDMYDLRSYLLYKEYDVPFDIVEGMALAEAHEKANDFTQKVLSDFVYGDKSYTHKENSKNTIYTINDNWDKGNVRISISKNNVETTVDAFSHDLDGNISGRVLLDNLLFATGDNLGKYNYVTVKSLARNHSMLENSLEELIEKWDKDESVKVITISKTTNYYSNIDQFIVTLHDTDNNHGFENYIIEVKR